MKINVHKIQAGRRVMAVEAWICGVEVSEVLFSVYVSPHLEYLGSAASLPAITLLLFLSAET